MFDLFIDNIFIVEADFEHALEIGKYDYNLSTSLTIQKCPVNFTLFAVLITTKAIRLTASEVGVDHFLIIDDCEDRPIE